MQQLMYVVIVIDPWKLENINSEKCHIQLIGFRKYKIGFFFKF